MIECHICCSVSVFYLTIVRGYKVYQCGLCGYIFIEPRPSKRELTHYYKNFDYKDLSLVENRVRSDAKISLNFIRSALSKSVSLLDIGCGRGYFLDEAKKSVDEVYGIDLSSKMSKYATDKFDIPVWNADINDFKSKRKFNVVTLNQVIEHVVDVNTLIQKVYELLSDKGYLYIATPNIKSASARVFGNDFEYYIPPEHINYFSIDTLSKLLIKHNFNIVKTGTWGYPENLAGIIKRIVKPKNGKMEPLTSSSQMTRLKSHDSSSTRGLKYMIFDEILCNSTYRLLDLFNLGINIHLLAQKY